MARSPLLVLPSREISTLGNAEFTDEILKRIAAGARPVTLFGRPDDDKKVVVTAVLASPDGLSALRTETARGASMRSITTELPRFHAFERELHEQHDVGSRDHPWLKPIRYEGGLLGKQDTHPFWKLEGKEVHEVAVGPIHAGVIEPGHFRFMCYGELVHHLEISLGYQHRGVEKLLLGRDAKLLAPIVESICGDSSVAYVTGYSRAIEALANAPVDVGQERLRAVALELERIAMHLVGLAGLCTDVAFLPGSSTYGRLRTSVINASMRICGSRFGRGWIRPGGARHGMTTELVTTIREILEAFQRDITKCNDLTFASKTVRHRLETTGTVTKEKALAIGLLGMAARASGVELDLRSQLPDPAFAERPIPMVVELAGDCYARLKIRAREIDESLAWLFATFAWRQELPAKMSQLGSLMPGTFVASLVEGWRGEIVQCLETDATGKLRHYKVQDPSLLNWFGLAQSVRENEIYDFPICNKSFDLSYCGNDL